jgi:serine/threonine protein phosphatase PrpC
MHTPCAACCLQDLPAEQLLHLHRHQQQQQQQGHHHHQQQQQPGEAAAPLSAGDGAPAATAGGSNAAAAAAAEQQLLPAIDIVTSNGSWVLPALSRSFVTLDHEFGAISEGSYVGSTAVVVLVGGQRLWVAHAGDSRAVLGRAGALQVLTSDHKASRDDEVARVQVGWAEL